MAKKKTTKKSTKPKSFSGVIRGHSRSVQDIAKALRDVVVEELPDVQESYYGGQRAMAMYRTVSDVCWIQPLKERCNLYLMYGPELKDPRHLLHGSSDRYRFARIGSVDEIEELPIRKWLQESQEHIEAAMQSGVSFDQVLAKLQSLCLSLPRTKETQTWGKPHFRVGEKIFCGCGEDQGRPRIGLKMEKTDAQQMMKMPGIEKAPYSRPNDGWVSIDPNVFDCWDEIGRLVIDSYRLIAPKRVAALLDE